MDGRKCTNSLKEVHTGFIRPSQIAVIAAPFWRYDENWSHEDFALKPGFAARLAKIAQVFLYHSTDDEVIPLAHFYKYFDSLKTATALKLKGYNHYFKDGLPALINDLIDIRDED